MSGQMKLSLRETWRISLPRVQATRAGMGMGWGLGAGRDFCALRERTPARGGAGGERDVTVTLSLELLLEMLYSSCIPVPKKCNTLLCSCLASLQVLFTSSSQSLNMALL